MITIEHIKNPELKTKIDSVLLKENVWIGTAFENFHILSTNKKGSIGEFFVEQYMRSRGSIVKPKVNTGHDRVVDGYKTEIKFSLSHHINHLSICKDWERCISVVIRPEISKSIFVWFTKDNFIDWVKTTDVFRPQAAGNSEGNTNDDYWIDSDKRLERLLLLPGVMSISEWNHNALLS